ncbi:glycosyltransferase [Alphaproteobacteria bacterium]|nr:glycosyltransferase [Alphaproteobacteria bacterium]
MTVCFNSESTLLDTIVSFQSQCYKEKEHLIIDGDSTDKTFEIVQENRSSIAYFVSEQDDGLYDAMNKGIKKATGDVIGILNSDDFFCDTNVLSEVAKAFAIDPAIEVVCGGVELVHRLDLNLPLRTYSLSFFKPWMMRFGIMPPHPAVFIKKSAYNRVGLYKQKYGIAADFDLLTRLFILERVKYFLTVSVFVRMRTGGLSNGGWKSLVRGTQEIRGSLKENGVYTNLFMVMVRLPFKFLTQTVKRLPFLNSRPPH